MKRIAFNALNEIVSIDFFLEVLKHFFSKCPNLFVFQPVQLCAVRLKKIISWYNFLELCQITWMNNASNKSNFGWPWQTISGSQSSVIGWRSVSKRHLKYKFIFQISLSPVHLLVPKLQRRIQERSPFHSKLLFELFEREKKQPDGNTSLTMDSNRWTVISNRYERGKTVF